MYAQKYVVAHKVLCIPQFMSSQAYVAMEPVQKKGVRGVTLLNGLLLIITFFSI